MINHEEIKVLKELKDKVYSVLLGSKHMQTTEVYQRIQDESTSKLGKDKFQAIQTGDSDNSKLLKITANTVKYDLVPAPIRRALGIDQPEEPQTIVRLSAIPLIEGLVYSSLLFQGMLFTSIKNRLTDTFSKDGGFRPLQRVKSFLQSIALIGISGLMVMVSTIYALPLLIKLPVQSILSYINVNKRLREEIKALQQLAASKASPEQTSGPLQSTNINPAPNQSAQLEALKKELAAAKARAEAAEMNSS